MAVVVGFVLWYSVSREAHTIQPLIPALQSWWMKIHVPANFIGYGAFCIAAMLGIAELLALRKEDAGKKSWLPHSQVIEEVMYKAIAVGFLFFTIATILGALWAADAWGRYWSWDPKETWAFIVWLNYAIWLHLRLVAGWRGKVLAWWAVIGLVITAFAFIGVNYVLERPALLRHFVNRLFCTLFQTAFFRFLLLQKRIFIRTQGLFLNQLRV